MQAKWTVRHSDAVSNAYRTSSSLFLQSAPDLCRRIVQSLAKALEDGAAPQLILLDLRGNPLGAGSESVVVSFMLCSTYQSSRSLNPYAITKSTQQAAVILVSLSSSCCPMLVLPPTSSLAPTSLICRRD